MTEDEKKLLQAKHRQEAVEARNRQKERKQRTRRLIQQGAILEKIYGVKYDYDMMRQSKLEVKKMLGEVTRKPSITQMLQRKEPESQMQKPPKRKQKDYER